MTLSIAPNVGAQRVLSDRECMEQIDVEGPLQPATYIPSCSNIISSGRLALTAMNELSMKQWRPQHSS